MQDGRTALIAATANGHTAVVEYLARLGCDLDCKHNVSAGIDALQS
jgi:ankyrin repeat protein